MRNSIRSCRLVGTTSKLTIKRHRRQKMRLSRQGINNKSITSTRRTDDAVIQNDGEREVEEMLKKKKGSMVQVQCFKE